RRGAALAAPGVQRLRHRGRALRAGRAGPALAGVRESGCLLRPHLRGGQEDPLDRRRPGAVVPAALPLRPPAAAAAAPCGAAMSSPRPTPNPVTRILIIVLGFQFIPAMDALGK